MKRLLCGLGLGLLLSGAGCASIGGTIYSGARAPYAGVIVDSEIVASGEPGWTALAVADFPLTAAVDTALLPVTLPAYAIHELGRQQ